MKRALFLIAGLTAVGGLAAGGVHLHAQPDVRRMLYGPPNILLVTVDTLRADHTSLHGYSRPTTPNLKRFFQEATIYDRAYSATAKTAASAFSFLTGLYPQHHGVRLQRQKMPDDLVTVAKLLGEAGYQTAGVVSNSVLAREATGLDAHFDYYDDYVFQKEEYRNFYERDARNTTIAALKWLESERKEGKPCFLWVHYMDPHGPYHPPDYKPVDFDHDEPLPVDPKRIPGYVREPGNDDGRDYIDRYDEETAYFDHEARKLLDAWEELGLGDHSVEVVTADHGETMMDHKGWFRHSYHVFEELVHVPLAVRGAGFPAARVEEPVTNLDVTPTILQAAGLPIPDGLDGEPLDATPRPRHIFVESSFARKQWRGALEAGSSRKYMVLIRRHDEAPRFYRQRFYDLRSDPGEKHKKAWPPEPEWSAGARALVQWVHADQDLGRKLPRKYDEKGIKIDSPKVPEDIAPNVDERALEQLRALGYVQ